MSLAERLQEARAKAKPSFERWLDALEGEDRTEMLDALGDSRLPSKVLIGIVRSQGVSVGEERFKEIRLSHGYIG